MQEAITILETEGLLLRRFRESDLQDLYEYLFDEAVVKFEPYKAMCLSEVQVEPSKRIASDEMIAVVLKETGKLIGNLYFGKREFGSMELGYVFNRQYWNRHYARESCRALIEKAFDEGVHRIYAECDTQNTASWRLLESLGFIKEAYFRQNVYFWLDASGRPVWKDTFVYSLLNKEHNTI